MSVSRRGIFGLFAAAPAAVAAGKVVAEPAPEFYVGQIRAVHSHYETKLAPRFHTWAAGASTTSGSFTQTSYATEAVAVLRHEQWNGTEWLPISEPSPRHSTGEAV